MGLLPNHPQDTLASPQRYWDGGTNQNLRQSAVALVVLRCWPLPAPSSQPGSIRAIDDARELTETAANGLRTACKYAASSCKCYVSCVRRPSQVSFSRFFLPSHRAHDFPTTLAAADANADAASR